MSEQKEYQNKCFSPNWLEVDLSRAKQAIETKKRKDLATLLKELSEIKENIEMVEEKQHRLSNLMKFYTGDFA